MGKSHGVFVCDGGCALSTEKYQEQLMGVVAMLTESIGRQLITSDSNNWPSFMVVDLCPPDSHCRPLQIRQFPSESVTAPNKLVKNFLSKLPAGAFSERSGNFNPVHEILLWQSVITEDSETLVVTLDSVQQLDVPKCLLGILLMKAIERGFDEGVRYLLNHGASPNSGPTLDSANEPLIRTSEILIASQLDQGNTKERTAAIMKTLVVHGADLSKPLNDRGTLPIHQVGLAAAVNLETALTIISRSPDEVLNKCDMTENNKHSVSALSLVLETAVCRCFRHFGNSSTNILLFAAVPLIRAGARAIPDPILSERGAFLELSANTAFHEIDPSAKFDATFFLRILIESRWKTSLDVPKFQDLANSLTGLPLELMKLVFNVYAETLIALFPRPLQAICRSAILQQLPIGVVKRSVAIDKLEVPQVLKDYLNFSDLVPNQQ